MLSNTAQKNAARNPNGTRRKNARAGGLGIRGGLGRTGGRHTRPPPQPPLGGGYGGGLSFACYPTARLATEVAVTTDHPNPKPHSSDRNTIYNFFRMTLIVFFQPRLANYSSMPASKLRPSWPQALNLVVVGPSPTVGVLMFGSFENTPPRMQCQLAKTLRG